jgi:hypothetical protein
MEVEDREMLRRAGELADAITPLMMELSTLLDRLGSATPRLSIVEPAPAELVGQFADRLEQV